MMKLRIYKSGILRISWKWKLIARNGRIVASGRGFNSYANCKESVDLVSTYFVQNYLSKQSKPKKHD